MIIALQNGNVLHSTSDLLMRSGHFANLLKTFCEKAVENMEAL